MTTCKLAAAHVAPVFLDGKATINKALSVIAEAARAGAQLVAFPETFVPAFPVWSALRAPIHNHQLFEQLVANSLLVPGPEIDEVREAANHYEMIVSLGINERTSSSVGTLFNSNLLIDANGGILNHHRKLVPTFYEKLSWAAGDGAGLRVCDTHCGRVGMLICGENTNPLARYTLMAQAEQIHIATYPPIWPTHEPSSSNNYDLAHAIRLRAGAHSFEAKAFTLVVGGFMDEAMFQQLASLDKQAAAILDSSPRSVSLATDPSGHSFAGEASDSETILYADVDTSQCLVPKQFHDVSGGYNRFDVFDLRVNRCGNRPVTFHDEPETVDTLETEETDEPKQD